MTFQASSMPQDDSTLVEHLDMSLLLLVQRQQVSNWLIWAIQDWYRPLAIGGVNVPLFFVLDLGFGLALKRSWEDQVFWPAQGSKLNDDLGKAANKYVEKLNGYIDWVCRESGLFPLLGNWQPASGASPKDLPTFADWVFSEAPILPFPIVEPGNNRTLEQRIQGIADALFLFLSGSPNDQVSQRQAWATWKQPWPALIVLTRASACAIERNCNSPMEGAIPIQILEDRVLRGKMKKFIGRWNAPMQARSDRYYHPPDWQVKCYEQIADALTQIVPKPGQFARWLGDMVRATAPAYSRRVALEVNGTRLKSRRIPYLDTHPPQISSPDLLALTHYHLAMQEQPLEQIQRILRRVRAAEYVEPQHDRVPTDGYDGITRQNVGIQHILASQLALDETSFLYRLYNGGLLFLQPVSYRQRPLKLLVAVVLDIAHESFQKWSSLSQSPRRAQSVFREISAVILQDVLIVLRELLRTREKTSGLDAQVDICLLSVDGWGRDERIANAAPILRMTGDRNPQQINESESRLYQMAMQGWFQFIVQNRSTEKSGDLALAKLMRYWIGDPQSGSTPRLARETVRKLFGISRHPPLVRGILSRNPSRYDLTMQICITYDDRVQLAALDLGGMARRRSSIHVIALGRDFKSLKYPRANLDTDLSEWWRVHGRERIRPALLINLLRDILSSMSE
ncbi:hypothetical protein ANRL3_03013 [Anaerolineae bacterium]|nr:hypothetical protein ANRL3_03013 [Anaerolineae bacterium]